MDNLQELMSIAPYERILLLPHCLRQSSSCRASYNQEGLQCAACNTECVVNILRGAALEAGYKGVCVAPGGHLALKYVQEKKPRAIVAVACEKELREGVEGVKDLAELIELPVIVIIPLVKDGCIDTEVDVQAALDVINAGCMEPAGNKVIKF